MADFKLIEAIDQAAERLLDMAGFGAKVSAEPVKATLPEQVKAFEAAVEWAKTRNDLAPPDRKESKFDGIRNDFNKTGKRRRGVATTPVEAEPRVDAAESEPPADTEPDLFDA
jgi:hypothetical protein